MDGSTAFCKSLFRRSLLRFVFFSARCLRAFTPTRWQKGNRNRVVVCPCDQTKCQIYAARRGGGAPDFPSELAIQEVETLESLCVLYNAICTWAREGDATRDNYG